MLRVDDLEDSSDIGDAVGRTDGQTNWVGAAVSSGKDDLFVGEEINKTSLCVSISFGDFCVFFFWFLFVVGVGTFTEMLISCSYFQRGDK